MTRGTGAPGDDGDRLATPTQAAALSGALLEAEEERQRSRAPVEEPIEDQHLPGVGGESLSLRDGLRRGGPFTFVVLLLLNSLDELEASALAVLAPDIRDTFGIGDGAIVFISAASGGFVVLGALPMGWLADRFRRAPIVGFSSIFFAAMVFASGLAANAFALFCSRFGAGIGKSNTLPVHSSLIADTYPIGVRGRLSATTAGAGMTVAVLSPALVGGIAALAGGTEGWRWAYLLLGVPVFLLAFVAFRIPEPPRGQHEMLDVLGEVLETDTDPAISLEAAFARLRQVRTLSTVLVAFAAMGFGIFTGPVLANLYVEDRWGLEVFERGLIGSLGGLGVLAVLPFTGRRYDALYRRDPARALRLVGYLILPVAVLLPLQYSMPHPVLFAVVGVGPTVCLMTAATMVGPILQSIMPYRLRGMGAALGSIYIFFVGAMGGALVAALAADALGPRGTVLALAVPSSVIGALLVMRSARFIRHDLALVARELEEEREESQRQQAEPSTVPALQVNDVDFSYGSVQVLFDVAFEVRRGEVLALLGTNGAGKSTILRVIAGLGTPARGVVRLGGTNITFMAPEQRVHHGIQLLPGGRALFPAMSVQDNLEMGAFVYRGDPTDRDRRIARALDLFPQLHRQLRQPAGSLSGGQQQMLALATTLLHDPELLLIDELSLGLSPIVVQDLLGVIERLKEEGMTMILVEQSINVALTVADRAVFLEKGQVRFEGTGSDLLERDDLVRAVFLGPEGG